MTPEPLPYPRLEGYLRGLPRGIDSFPDCQAKATIVRNLLEDKPLKDVSAGGVPEILLGWQASPPLNSAWVSEVQLMSLSLALSDHYRMSEEAYLFWLRQQNLRLFDVVVYRLVMGVSSPATLMSLGSSLWRAMHRGTRVELLQTQTKEMTFKLDYPAGLYTPLLLRTYAVAFEAALAHSKARLPTVELFEDRAGMATFQAHWQ